MKRILKMIAACLIAGYLVVTFVAFRLAAEKEVCTGVDVRILDEDDAHFIGSKDIEIQIVRSRIKLKGKPLGEINTEAVEEAVRKNLLVKRVECYKTPGGAIRIDVKQRIPVLRVAGVNGSFYVDKDGEYMPVSSSYTLYLPVATGNVDKEFATKELYKFSCFLQENDFWNAQIEQIHVLQNKEIELIPRVGDHKILLGKLDHFEEKLDNLICFYEQALPKIGWNKYDKINIKYANQVICTKRKN